MAKQRSKSKPSAVPQKTSGAKTMTLPDNGKKRVLHVGCGVYNPEKLHARFRGGDWQEIRLDIDPKVKPDIISDIRSMPMVPDNSMDAVWSSHNVEHLYPHEVVDALKEFYRVVKEGGFVLITLPDLQVVAEHITAGRMEEPLYKSPAGPIYALDVLYGFRKSLAEGNLYMAHNTGFTAPALGKSLREAGFSTIRVQRTEPDLWAIGFKYPQGHPNRTDRIMVLDDRLGPTGLPDELDRPPTMWKINPPLNKQA